MNFGHFNYIDAAAPSGYKCQTCGAHGCKLWREYQTFADHTDLLCCDCAAKSQKKDVSTIDADGRRLTEEGGRTDQIGWFVPAVPTEEGDTYWGYTSVPETGCCWWRSLPTRRQS
ncbi:MAG TPA: hypothetical protein VFA98_16595 [Thermoanaerobaculia bacterium]|jgi:hypothetical protein|nr:hypothetical protein [Thermoanaerobaculia bacterium]